MTRDRDIRELEHKISNLELTLAQNEKDADIYRASMISSMCIIEDLEGDLASEKLDMESKRDELRALIGYDKEERTELTELTAALEYLKNGPPEVKAFMNPRPASEKKITAYGV